MSMSFFNVQMCKCANGRLGLMCKCANVQMCEWLPWVNVQMCECANVRMVAYLCCDYKL